MLSCASFESRNSLRNAASSAFVDEILDETLESLFRLLSSLPAGLVPELSDELPDELSVEPEEPGSLEMMSSISLTSLLLIVLLLSLRLFAVAVPESPVVLPAEPEPVSGAGSSLSAV